MRRELFELNTPKGTVRIENEAGIGACGDTRNAGYRSYFYHLRPSDFLKLAGGGEDFYLLHRDWFSDMLPYDEAMKRGLIGERPKKFVYNDNYGCIIFRNEVLLKFNREDWQMPGISASTNIVMKLAKILGLDETDLCFHVS